MKKKKNIIKKINLSKNYKFIYFKQYKHYYKEFRLKNKFFFKVLNNINSIKKIINIVKLKNYLNLKINNLFLNKLNSYFNYLTNDLNLKYNNKFIDLTQIRYISDLHSKKNIIININTNIDIINYQNYLFYLNNKYVSDTNIIVKKNDLFFFNKIFFYQLYNIYKLNLLLLLLINNFFKNL